MIEPVPTDSIYIWMFRQGRHGVDIDTVLAALAAAKKEIRAKDMENYWNGWHRYQLYSGDIWFDMPECRKPNTLPEFDEFPLHPWTGIPEVANRYVPCNADNRPMIKWGNGCMDKTSAETFDGQVYLAENLKGTRFIVLDIDGNHGDGNMDTVKYFDPWRKFTHAMVKPNCSKDGYPLSFHLTFHCSRVIPTMHFNEARLDIIGNKENSLRYFKNKEWNGKEPATMTPALWTELKNFIERSKRGD